MTDRLRISIVYDLFYRIGIDNDDKYHTMRQLRRVSLSGSYQK